MALDSPPPEPNRALMLGAGLVGLAVVAAVLAAALRNRPPKAPREDRVLIVTTTPVLASLTANVAGAQAEIYNLLPPGSSPHTYALRPADADALSRADALVMNGLGLEQFLDQALAHLPSDVHRIEAAEGIRVIEALPREDEPEGEEPGGPARSGFAAGDAGGPDAHVWLDPQRAMQMIENISRGLVAADPAHAERYERNARAAIDRLRVLDAEFAQRLKPTPRKDFIAFHPAWPYFAERYGLKQVAVIEAIPGKEPTARELRALTELVRATGVRALLTETQFSPRAAEALARDLNLVVEQVNPEGGNPGPSGYEEFMRANVEAFARALNP